MKKTNAMRMLESMGIPFRVEKYDVDPDDLSAVAVAAKINLDPGRVYKTLLIQGRESLYFAVLPANRELDQRKFARLLRERKTGMVPVKDIQRLTGYIRGGVTVIGAKKSYPVFVDQTATEHQAISVSAGVRGMQLILDPYDYLRATSGSLGDIIVE